MRKRTLLKQVLLLCALMVGSGSAWADTYTWTAATGQLSTSKMSVEVNDVTWNLAVTWSDNSKTYVNFSSPAYQIGSKNNPASAVTLSTSGITGTITSVKVKWSSAGANTCSLGVTVGGTALTNNSNTTVNNNTRTIGETEFTGSASGALSLNFSCTTGIKFQQVVVTYTPAPKPAPTITFSNGNVRVGQNLDLRTLFTSNSEGAVTYSITAGGSYASLAADGYTLSGVAEGDVTVKAEQAAQGAYNAGDATATITVDAALTLTGIAITNAPDKTVYEEGETFDPTGMVVTATYSDDSQADVTAYCSFTPSGALTQSDTDVEVSYTENGTTKTANQAITVTEVVDYATLPFKWAGGGSASLTSVKGVTANGLGTTDYAGTHAPYNVKFDTADDYIQIKTDAMPGKVSVGVKMVGGANASAITVQASADGEEFRDIEDLSISGSQNSVLTLATTKAFAATDRFVRLNFKKGTGSNVGVGPISIALGISDAVDYTPVAKTDADVTLNREFVADWNGVVLPFDITDAVKTALGATEVKTLESATEDAAGAVTLTFGDATLPVAAGTPVLVKLSAAKTSVDLEGIAIKTTAPTTVEKSAGGSTFTLTGTYSSVDLQASEAYFVSGTKFYHKAEGIALAAAPFRAYIVQTTEGGSAPASVSFDLEGDEHTTGIVEMDTMRTATDGSVYNLCGQRVSQPTKGLYIVSGKKYVVK